MWSVEHSVETEATPEVIWRLWADVPGWPAWNSNLASAELTGDFAAGSTIRMNETTGDVIELQVAEAVEPELFVDEAVMDAITVRTSHRVEPVDDHRRRIVYRMEITGPAADEVGPEIGPAISGDFPETLAALARQAER